MNIQNLMKMAIQQAETQQKNNAVNQTLETFRLLIMLTTLNDYLEQDEVNHALEKSAKDIVQKWEKLCKFKNDDELDQFKAIVSLAKTEVKSMLSGAAEIMEAMP